MQVSSGRPHMLSSNQRGRGQEPVTVQGRILSAVIVNMGFGLNPSALIGKDGLRSNGRALDRDGGMVKSVNAMPPAINAQFPAPTSSEPLRSGSMTNYRWLICALLFLGTTVNYVDRQVVGLLKPILEQQFKWTESDYANIVFCFQLAYAIGLLLVGGIL